MITYECTTCGHATELTNTRSKAAERLVKACDECGDVSCHQMAQELPDELDDEARDMLRAVNPTVLVRRSSKGDKTYHIKHGEKPLCGSDADVREVSIEAFPPGFYGWCRHCVQVARDGNARCPGGSGPTEVTEQECIESIKAAGEECDKYLSRERYRDSGHEPTVHEIVTVFGSWADARTEALGWSQ